MKKIYTKLFAFLLLMSPFAGFAQPSNDNTCDATLLVVDDPALLGSNVFATAQVYEAAPPDGPCEFAWCDGLEPEFTVWYQFVAPSNGAVVISTCFEATDMDTQIALWTAGDCDDFSTYDFVAANDDAIGGCDTGDQFASILSIDGLNAGDTYYIQFDGFDGAQDIFEIEVTTGIPTSLVNIVHNSADLALAVVDLWIEGELVEDDMEFRTCTGYLELMANTNLFVAICDAGSVDDSSPLYSTSFTLDAAKDYVAILNGIYSDSGYSPELPLGFALYDDAHLAGPGFGMWDILFHNGVTDSQAFDVELLDDGSTIAENIFYNDFNSAGYVELPAGNYSIDLTDENGNTMGNDYCLQLGAFGSPALTVITSGFMDPSQNSNGPAFGLFYVNHFNGTVEPAIEGACPIPINDFPCDAIEIIVDAAPTTHDNSFATADEGEVNPPNLPLDDPEADCINLWCDGTPVDNTLWFKFVAPSTGSVAITTCFATSFDNQVAVWTATSCSDYSTFGFHQCNDDADGGCGDGDVYASAFFVYSLTSGNTYWVQVDGWGGGTGAFDIEIFTNVGVEENSAINFNAFPNPAKDLLNITCEEYNATATLRDVIGREVKTFAVNGNTAVDVNEISSGIYTLTLSANGVSTSTRIVIE
ncbi:MAG: T9SS type A sorting domain-containing protein [Flavobacteriales bacterium]|nr:T9SS type A sorting domain-containing protein [Flavobacteriales bacterium]